MTTDLKLPTLYIIATSAVQAALSDHWGDLLFGWSLTHEDDDDGDRLCREFFMERGNEKHHLDLSPWVRSVPTEIQAMFVALGFPRRDASSKVSAPLTFDQIRAAFWRKQAMGLALPEAA